MGTDYLEMLDAANDWGPVTDPERQWFFRGWLDERDSCSVTPPGDSESNPAAWAAYNSGRVAKRSLNSNPTAH